MFHDDSGYFLCLQYGIFNLVHHADDPKNDQGDGNGGYGSFCHVTYVGKQIGTRHGWSQVGRIRQRGHLIPKIGAGNNSTGNNPFLKTQCASDP